MSNVFKLKLFDAKNNMLLSTVTLENYTREQIIKMYSRGKLPGYSTAFQLGVFNHAVLVNMVTAEEEVLCRSSISQ